MAWAAGTTLLRQAIPLDEILVEHSFYGTAALRRRLLIAGLKKAACEKCGLKQWFDDPVPLELDHINGDHCDNRISNLQILCANCHAIKTKRQSAESRKESRKCPLCGISIAKRSKLCQKCRFIAAPRTPKINWPEDTILLQAHRDRKVLPLARSLGVSDGAIHKRIRKIKLKVVLTVEHKCEELSVGSSNLPLETLGK
jgi:hypothetical protein